jgi:phosphate-selective porin OprO/OprP
MYQILPFEFIHAVFACRLLLVYLLILPGILSAQDTPLEITEPVINDPCVPDSPTEDDQQTVEQGQVDEQGDGCVTQQEEEIIEEKQQEAALAVAEDTQDAVTLKQLLLGRNYVFFGRVELDYAIYSGDIPSSENGGDLRRLRVGMAGLATFLDRVSYKLELDLSDGTNNISDLYVQWDTRKHGSFKLGNQRVSQNLSAMTSSLSQLFMERPLPVTTFSLRRRLAVSYDVDRGRWGMHGMFFTHDPNNDTGKYGWAFRLFTKPIRGPEKVGHVGVSVVSEKMDREARYRTRPESHVTGIRLVDTGLFDDVQYQHTAGLELAGGVKTYSMRLELFRSRWERTAGRHNTFNGAYLEVGHFLTGQDFNYTKGKFVRPALEPGARAWEVGLRASWVDLDDRDVRGGQQWNVGAALNYYRRPELRFMLNLLRFRTHSVAGDDRGWILQARVQYNR